MAKGQEPANSLQAFEDYFDLGEARSLEALTELYQSRTEAAPTRQLTTLKQWSRRFGWQERVRNRVREKNEATWAAIKSDVATERAKAYRRLNKALLSIEKQLDSGVPADVAKLTDNQKQLFQLLEAPLVEKTDVNVTGHLDVSLIDKLSPETRQGMLRDLEGEDEEADAAADEASG